MDGLDLKHGKVEIPYHLIDVVHPRTEFNLAKYQGRAYKAIEDILCNHSTSYDVISTNIGYS